MCFTAILLSKQCVEKLTVTVCFQGKEGFE